jgi:ATP-dependent DNA helicase RecQ
MFNLFGCGVDHDEKYWMALLGSFVSGFLSKDIETMVL